MPSGLMSLNIKEIGNYDQCVSIQQQIGPYKNLTFKGQYCLCPILPLIIPENPLYDTIAPMKPL